MGHGNELFTSAVIGSLFTGVLGYFIRRWMDRIETKVDALIEAQGKFVSREEYERSISRIHQRLDDHLEKDHRGDK